MYTAEDRTPFTYLIGWSNLNKWYYGVKYAKNCNPSDLFSTYFTSSKRVKDFIEINGLPNIIQIRKVFNSVETALKWEHRVLQFLDVIHESKWLNAHDGKAISPEAASMGARKSKNKEKWNENDPRRKHLSILSTERNIISRLNTDEARAKSLETRNNNLKKLSKEEKNQLTAPMRTKEATENRVKNRLSNFNALSDIEKANIVQQRSDTTKSLHKSGAFDNAYTDERNNKIREAKLISNPGFASVTCTYCDKSGQLAAMKRWHFNNCKMFSELI